MKKLLLHYPLWKNRWIPYFKEELKSRYDLYVTHTMNKDELSVLSEECDILLSMWLNGVVYHWAKEFPQKKIISYLRRYEIHETTLLSKMPWENVDAMVFVNAFFAEELFPYQLGKYCPEALNKKMPSTHLIYNSVDSNEFSIFESDHDRKPSKIAFSCSAKPVKNLPLAAAILAELPEEYTLHHVGLPYGDDVFGGTTFGLYLKQLGLENRWIFEGVKKRDEMPSWYADKDFILSTSISEGNPMNVIEGMLAGLKPIVHNWPGAQEQFGKQNVFNTVEDAIELFGEPVRPKQYRKIAQEKFSLENIKAIHGVIDEVMSQ